MKRSLLCGIFALTVAVFADEFDEAYAQIEREIATADRANETLQAGLSRSCALTDFRNQVKVVNGTNVWTSAFQSAIDKFEIVRIPARSEPYYLDGTVHIPSNRRIEAAGATIRFVAGVRNIMLRNINTRDGVRAPIPANNRDTNIAIVGGRWEDCCKRRAGYGSTGRYDVGPWGFGNFMGVSTLFLFNNCNNVTVKNVTFVHCGGFAFQAGDGDAYHLTDIVFEGCFADGLHLNGGLTRVHAARVKGKVGDDLLALNAYDWLNSSVNFAPQRFLICEDFELLGGYPAIRILPGTYRFPDGSKVDCAISDVIIRRVKGVNTYKLYLQPPAYYVGNKPEWGEVGSGGNLFFEDLTIDVKDPSDLFSVYTQSDPVRGHFAAFEIGSNLSGVVFRNLDVTFHCDRYPLSHLATVGPKSAIIQQGKKTLEVFAPYLTCTVGVIRCENVRVKGVTPKELVHTTSFDNVNKDGLSTGCGVLKDLQVK